MILHGLRALTSGHHAGFQNLDRGRQDRSVRLFAGREIVATTVGEKARLKRQDADLPPLPRHTPKALARKESLARRKAKRASRNTKLAVGPESDLSPKSVSRMTRSSPWHKGKGSRAVEKVLRSKDLIRPKGLQSIQRARKMPPGN